MPALGTEINDGHDEKGYERRKRLEAVAECPGCGGDVECWAETEAWTRGASVWHHSEYGGAMGMCENCNVLIADCLSDGFQVFDLSRKE